MRLCHYFALAAFCLLALGLRTSAERARAQSSPSAWAAAPRVSTPTWEVKRFGLDPESAREKALSDASEEAAQYLHKNVPALRDWSPPQESLVSKGVISLLAEPEPKAVEGGGPMAGFFEATVKVEISSKSLGQLMQEARTDRMHDRQLLLARLLAAVVAVLLVITGYLRLEDATRGYYTTLLRLAAVGVVVIVGAGLLLLA
jgi:hypothetical protein